MNICSISEKREVKALALGGFDGIHLGHRALILALGEGGAILAIEQARACLTPGRTRERFSAVPVCLVAIDEIAQMRPAEFVAYLKSEFPALRKLVVGYDFRFGKDRSGGGEDLRRIFDGETTIVGEVQFGGAAVHTARIRLLLLDGDVAAAAKLLARDHLIEGEIISGQGLGAARLYPTINLAVTRFLVPIDGVYASRTEVAGRLYRSVSFVGKRLSADGEFAIESHILEPDFEVDFETGSGLGRSAAIFFVDRLRQNQRFETLDELKAQIALDIAAAKTILN